MATRSGALMTRAKPGKELERISNQACGPALKKIERERLFCDVYLKGVGAIEKGA